MNDVCFRERQTATNRQVKTGIQRYMERKRERQKQPDKDLTNGESSIICAYYNDVGRYFTSQTPLVVLRKAPSRGLKMATWKCQEIIIKSYMFQRYLRMHIFRALYKFLHGTNEIPTCTRSPDLFATFVTLDYAILAPRKLTGFDP